MWQPQEWRSQVEILSASFSSWSFWSTPASIVITSGRKITSSSMGTLLCLEILKVLYKCTSYLSTFIYLLKYNLRWVRGTARWSSVLSISSGNSTVPMPIFSNEKPRGSSRSENATNIRAAKKQEEHMVLCQIWGDTSTSSFCITSWFTFATMKV